MSNTADINTTRVAVINYTAIVGDTFTPMPVTFTIDNVAESFAGAAVTGQVKKGEQIVATLGIVITGNSIQYSLTADITEDIVTGAYTYDVEKTVGDLVQTIQKGTIHFKKDVTR